MGNMSEENKEGNKVQANPYNMRKSWHTDDVMPTELQNADSGLFVPNPASNRSEPEATAENSNPEGSTNNTTATMDKVQDSALNVETNPYSKVDYKKRYDDLKRYYDRKLGEWTSRESDLKTQLRENRPKYTPPKSQEEVDSLKKQNSALAQREAQLELGRLHPDFNDIKESDDFHNWADSQPMEIKSWIYENNSDGRLAARAIDLYKKDRGLGLDKKTEKKTTTQNQGADLLVKTREQVQVPQSNEVVFNRSDIANMSDEEFMQYEKDIVKAQREGRIK